MRLLLPALVALLAATSVAANEVFRTVDERGVVVYSDRPLSARSERVAVESKPTDQARVAAQAAEQAAASSAADAQRRERSAADAQLTAGLAEQAERMAEVCRQAREASAAYERSPRLYEELPDGGRRYLSDEELVAARLAARQAVTDYCVD